MSSFYRLRIKIPEYDIIGPLKLSILLVSFLPLQLHTSARTHCLLFSKNTKLLKTSMAFLSCIYLTLPGQPLKPSHFCFHIMWNIFKSTQLHGLPQTFPDLLHPYQIEVTKLSIVSCIYFPSWHLIRLTA